MPTGHNDIKKNRHLGDHDGNYLSERAVYMYVIIKTVWSVRHLLESCSSLLLSTLKTDLQINSFQLLLI